MLVQKLKAEIQRKSQEVWLAGPYCRLSQYQCYWANMWIGVSQAGYACREELPVFLLIFSLPSAVAIFVKWKFL